MKKRLRELCPLLSDQTTDPFWRQYAEVILQDLQGADEPDKNCDPFLIVPI